MNIYKQYWDPPVGPPFRGARGVGIEKSEFKGSQSKNYNLGPHGASQGGREQ